jgi:hypothetical protein
MKVVSEFRGRLDFRRHGARGISPHALAKNFGIRPFEETRQWLRSFASLPCIA